MSTEVSFEDALTYSNLLPDSRRGVVVSALAGKQLAKLSGLGGERMKSFYYSQPVEIQREISFVAAVELIKVDPKAALVWRHETDDPTLSRALENRLLETHFANLIPFEVRTELIEERLKDETIYKRDSAAVSGYFLEGIKVKRDWTLERMSKLPESPLKDKVYRKVALEWSISDPVLASEWLTSLPLGKNRDAGLLFLVKNARTQTTEALANSTAISDPVMRIEAVSSVIGMYSGQPSLARSIIQGSSLSDADKNTLYQKIATLPKGTPAK